MGVALRDDTLFAEGRLWRDQRRTTAPAFAYCALRDYAPAVQSAFDDLLIRWRRFEGGAVVDAAAEMAGLALDVLTCTNFSDGLSGERNEVRENMRLYFNSVGRIDALDLLGVPEWFPRIGQSDPAALQPTSIEPSIGS